jgi:hypothetical protein
MEGDSTGRGGKKEAGAGTGLAVGFCSGNDRFAGTGGLGKKPTSGAAHQWPSPAGLEWPEKTGSIGFPSLVPPACYFWVNGRPGKVSVCSDCTAVSSFGSNPRAFTMVGAI